MLLAKPPPPVAAARLRFALSPDGEPAPSPARDTDTCPAPATAPACPAPATSPACPAPATAPACAVPSVRQELQSLQQDTLALQTQANGLLSEIQDARQSTVGAIDDLKSLFENLHATLRRSRERLRPEDDDDDDDEDDDGAGGARGCYTVLEGPELRKLCRGLSEACRAVESLRELLALEPRSRAISPPAECEKLRI